MPRAVAAKSAARKSRAPKGGHQLPETFPNGEILKDCFKKQWKLGSVIGQGGFGLIYLASDELDHAVGPDAEYVVKIEPHSNGPLFCELHFYQRVGKPDKVNDWLKEKKLKFLGVPKFISTGHHTKGATQYRFMVMPRFSTDLQKIFEKAGNFSRKSTYSLGIRMLETLEYIHENDYVHADIKASNMLLGFKGGKQIENEVYLVDYGLATKYRIDSVHKEYKEDPRKVHDGTIEFTSIDAHKGVSPSRRGDLEILAYCMLQWMCEKLPWENKLQDKEYVRDHKIRYMSDISSLMAACFSSKGFDVPGELTEFFQQIKKLNYDEKPNYVNFKAILLKGLKKEGCKDDWKLDLVISGTKPTPAKTTSIPRKRKLPDASVERKAQTKAGAKKKAGLGDGDGLTSPRRAVPSTSPKKQNGSPVPAGICSPNFNRFHVSPRSSIHTKPRVKTGKVSTTPKLDRIVSPRKSPFVRKPALSALQIQTQKTAANKAAASKKTVIRKRKTKAPGVNAGVQTTPSLIRRRKT